MFRYIGSPENGGAMLADGDIVRGGGRVFTVATAEALCVGERVFLVWALLRRAAEEEIE